MALATYTALTAEQKTFYEMKMLDRAVPQFMHLFWGQQGVHPVTQLPENEGDTINWRLMGALSAVTTPLTEGVTPSAQEISITSTTATVSEYGAYIRYTRKLVAMGIDQVRSEGADALGEQAGDSLDQLTRDVIVAGTTYQFASTATQRSEITAAMDMTAAEILEALATLKTANAKPVVDGKYVVITHPYTEYDIFTDTTFQAILSNSFGRGDTNQPWISGFLGEALGCRFYVSSNAKEWVDEGASQADVFATLVIGKGAFGIGGLAAYMPGAVSGEQDGNNTFQAVRPLQLIEKPFGSAGADDPLEQRASLAWYTTYVTKILREMFMVRIEHGTTLGS